MKTDKALNMRVCVITCYKQPDYVRAIVLRNSVKNSGNELILVKNKYKGLLRYPEVTLKLIITRLRYHPNAYIITFRGYEILPLASLICLGKPLVFDEFINPIEWSVYEHNKFKKNGIIEKLLIKAYRITLLTTKLILSDTESHREFSSNILGVTKDKFIAFPVGTDEDIFYPKSVKMDESIFTVFYYGNMLPLHGIEYVCEAAVAVAKVHKEVNFIVIGGGSRTEELVKNAIQNGASISYKKWVDFGKLPEFINRSNLCLGGPFGNTVQSKMVITGKTFQFMASGKPTIIGRTDENKVFVDKGNVIIVDQGSSDSIARAIIWALGHKSELTKIGNEGYKLYKSKFSSKHTAKIMNQLLSHVTSN